MPNSSTTNEEQARRGFAVDVVHRLRDAGHQALWAGGCVRDALLGKTPKDYDIATSALPDEVREVFGKRRTLPIGAAFGVITVLGPKPAGQIEVATFRTDADYTDGRRPDGVTFSDPEHDAGRRDFTINGLFFDPLEDKVIDYVGGQQDLAAGLIRAIGVPADRFGEDKLRMLRAVRFACALGFEIESGTADAIKQLASEITVVSAERIGAELSRMLLDANRERAVRELLRLNLLKPVLPEMAALDESGFEVRCGVLSRLNSPSLPLALAALLPREATNPAGSRIARRLKFTSDEAKTTDWLLDHFALINSAHTAPWPAVQRVLVHPSAGEMLALCEAEHAGPTDATRFCREKLALAADELNPPPLLDGAALIAAGYRPGPEFGRLLELVRDKQLLGELNSAEEALDFLKKLPA